MLTVTIADVCQFGRRSDVAVHQIYEESCDLDNALYNADRDGFNFIVLYTDLDNMASLADDVACAIPDCFVTTSDAPRLRLVK